MVRPSEPPEWSNELPSGPPSLSAGVLSALLHGGVLILLALLLGRSQVADRDEPLRSVALVLARPATANDHQYFDETSAEGSPDSAADTADPNSFLPDRQPAAGVDPSRPNADLPQLPTDHLDAGQWLQVPSGSRQDQLNRFLPPADHSELIEREKARLKANLPVGEPTSVSLFGSEAATGYRFVFLIDRSKSMGGSGLGAMEAAAKELSKALAHLKENHQFQVIAYHHSTVMIGRRQLLAATPENRALLEEYFLGLAAFGGTEHLVGLTAALALEPDAIFWMTDGGEPELDRTQMQTLQQISNGKTTINSIQFGFGPQRSENNFMRTLAKENGGSYLYIDMQRR